MKLLFDFTIAKGIHQPALKRPFWCYFHYNPTVDPANIHATFGAFGFSEIQKLLYGAREWPGCLTWLNEHSLIPDFNAYGKVYVGAGEVLEKRLRILTIVWPTCGEMQKEEAGMSEEMTAC